MHSHNMDSDSSMSMSSMSMGGDAPNAFHLQKMYWAFVGTAIGIATIVNIINHIQAAHRMSRRSGNLPATPKTALSRCYATLTAIARETSNAEIVPGFWRILRSQSISLGRFAIVAGNLVAILVLCFYKLNPADTWQWEDIGYRTGYISAAQLPLVVLLSGKRNIVGFLIGSSYERLNWLHRWVARTLFLTVTIHMGFWFRSWGRYDYIGQKLQTDVIARRGLAAWCILLFIFLSSFGSIRRWNYELFVLSHIVTFVGFLAAVYLHLPAAVKVYVWLPIGLYVFDRVVRWLYIAVTNLAIFHPKRRGQGFFTCRARIIPEAGNASRVVIDKPPFKWKPGAHVRLTCHGIAPFQSHPFTIASLPEAGSMQFFIKSHRGATQKIRAKGEKGQLLPTDVTNLTPSEDFIAIIDGPYGGSIRPLPQFDSVMLFAGGCGASFIIPLAQDIVNKWKQSVRISSSESARPCIPTRLVRLIWVVKSRMEWLWFAIQISQMLIETRKMQAESLEVALSVSVYVTCDMDFGAEPAACGQGAFMLHSEEPHGKLQPLTTLKTLGESDSSLKSQEEYEETKNLHCRCREVVEEEGLDTNLTSPRTTCCCNVRERSLEGADSGSQHEITPNSKLEKASASDDSSLAQNSTDMGTNGGWPSNLKTSTGRPHCRNLMRAFLEQARGESAIVVCGPQGLNNGVRRDVVSLSDERAVHKGTGAHGIYFWEEGFSY